MYEEVIDGDGIIIKYTNDEGQVWWIPVNESNAMYQQYLNWKQENN